MTDEKAREAAVQAAMDKCSQLGIKYTHAPIIHAAIDAYEAARTPAPPEEG